VTAPPTLRVARPSERLGALLAFYRDGLGLTLLDRFEDHDGFDGIVLGHPGAAWHLEFTRAHRHPAPARPSEDSLLVLYLPEPAAWHAAIARMRAAGFPPVAAANPYWDRAGLTFEDPDGCRVVLQRAAWRP
jgi:catechol 2,3-dioxygenase-like lactoylglutathione lyase family enzyme